MSIVAQFVGGPLDGETRELQSAVPTFFALWYEHRTGACGEHVYHLSPRYKLPPFRYDFVLSRAYAGGDAA